MPELPDVEVFRRYFEDTSLRQKIKSAKISDTRILEDISRPKLERALKNHKFTTTHRHGKYLLAKMENDTWLMLHFGMTGYLSYLEKKDEEPRHTRLLVTFTNGKRIAYVNQRIFGKLGLVQDMEKFIAEKSLGPDPLASDFDFAAFKEALGGRSGKVKSALMNQKAIAGIGNVYSDEILFQAGIHPEANISDLDEKMLKQLFRKTKHALQQVIKYQANPQNMPKSYLLPHRGSDGKCPKDGAKIKKAKVGGRTAYFCPKHQNK